MTTTVSPRCTKGRNAPPDRPPTGRLSISLGDKKESVTHDTHKETLKGATALCAYWLGFLKTQGQSESALADVLLVNHITVVSGYKKKKTRYIITLIKEY